MLGNPVVVKIPGKGSGYRSAEDSAVIHDNLVSKQNSWDHDSVDVNATDCIESRSHVRRKHDRDDRGLRD